MEMKELDTLKKEDAVVLRSCVTPVSLQDVRMQTGHAR